MKSKCALAIQEK